MSESLGAVSFDGGRVILPVERVYLEGGAYVVDVSLAVGVALDLSEPQPYTLYDPTGRVVVLAATRGGYGNHLPSCEDGWTLHLAFTPDHHETPRHAELRRNS